MGYANGLEVALKERDAVIERLRGENAHLLTACELAMRYLTRLAAALPAAALALALEGALFAMENEVKRLRVENRALRRLLRSPFQGEYRYVSEQAIDRAVADDLAEHER